MTTPLFVRECPGDSCIMVYDMNANLVGVRRLPEKKRGAEIVDMEKFQAAMDRADAAIKALDAALEQIEATKEQESLRNFLIGLLFGGLTGAGIVAGIAYVVWCWA